MFGKLPMLPFVIPFCIALFLVLLWTLPSRQGLTWARSAIAATATVYAGGILANTVFPIYLAWPHSDGPQILPLNLVPIAGYELADALMNILVFIPLGILAALMIARANWLRVVSIGAGVSLAIEITQFITARFAHGGHVADINDWLSNVLGSAIGFALYGLATRHTVLGRWLHHFRWQPKPAGKPEKKPEHSAAIWIGRSSHNGQERSAR